MSPATTASSSQQTRFYRAGFVLSLLVVIFVGIILLFWFTTRSLFSKNEHFIVKDVVVQSSGWWNNKGQEVIKLLDIRLGESNLFALNMPELKKTLEAQASIEKVNVSRVLPDTLLIKVEERIPRAFLQRSGSLWVVDSNCVVMSRDKCLNIRANLPVIRYRTDQPMTAGMTLPELEPALQLVMLCISDHVDIKVSEISLINPDELIFVMQYQERNTDFFTVHMPRKNVKGMLRVLESALITVKKSNDSRRNINLMFNGNVVLK